MNNINYLYYIWLTQIKGIGAIISKKLIDRFKSAEVIYNLDLEELLTVEGIGTETAKKIIESRSLTSAKNILKNCNDKEIKITIIDDDTFPETIKQYNDTPIVLYYKGTLHKNLTGIAIVGARRCTDYGKKITVEAAEFLAKNNISVISGMAKGIDSYAHTACLKASGFTVAVLGCSVDICYPKEHRELMKKIMENGVIISEYPPTTQPKPEYFPKRNRIISALSNKILVTEAGEKSGALITAEYAIKQKKELYAVPGDIYTKAFKGSNKLISDGAKIYLSTKQLLYIEQQVDDFIESRNSIIDDTNNSTLEKDIIKALSLKALTVDELVVMLKINRNKLINILFLMELSNKVKIIGGKYVS
ncbi:DNA-processing protein DprA [Clostridium sp. DJ247]|uniref:DNA-processing protein DprA n=1 Tax=Clostridium sp. DJ247 TaxID=2726188 RepID=UPI001627DFC5|nr:DNA-processing protein DprA [Clostridium sp. DJ247]MBC2581956.1 DNA-protecting protein DprA [Clostridium sp. DJ247]